MATQHFEIVVTRSEKPLDTRLLSRLLAANAFRQHVAPVTAGFPSTTTREADRTAPGEPATR